MQQAARGVEIQDIGDAVSAREGGGDRRPQHAVAAVVSVQQHNVAAPAAANGEHAGVGQVAAEDGVVHAAGERGG